jgi:hypothetical protein
LKPKYLLSPISIPQFWIVWSARRIEDAYARRALVQAYFIVFLLTTLALLRAQLTPGGHFNMFNWVNIGMFGFLSVYYAYFVFVEKISVFEGLDKVVA